MNVAQARAIATRWVLEVGRLTPGYAGAYFSGSILELARDATVPATSDVDIVVVVDGPGSPKLGKLLFRGVLLDVSYAPLATLADPVQVLADYHRAGAFRGPGIIDDPASVIAELQSVVSHEFARRYWVERRCAHARGNAEASAAAVASAATFHDAATCWLFANAIVTHVLLVADLENPTVRTRYVTAGRLLNRHGRLDFLETLFESLGCAELGPAGVKVHLDALGPVFDSAAAARRSPFPFASDISAPARPIAIDGSRELIDAGLHREAVFWIGATFARCVAILEADPGADATAAREGLDAFMADLDVAGVDDLVKRARHVPALLDEASDIARVIMDTHLEIRARPERRGR